MDWYYAKDGEKHGPISNVDLRNLALEGKIDPTDLVWREGLGDWIVARKVKGLFDSPEQKAAPAEPAPPATEPPATEPVEGAGETPTGDGAVPTIGPPPAEQAIAPEESVSLGEIQISTTRRKKKKKTTTTGQPPATQPPAVQPSGSQAPAVPPTVGPTQEPAAPAQVSPGVEPAPAITPAKAEPAAKEKEPVAAAPTVSVPAISPPESPTEPLSVGEQAPPPARVTAEVEIPTSVPPPRAKRASSSGSSLLFHPFDFIASGLRKAVAPSLINGGCKLFLVTGHFGMYAAMAAVVLFAGAFAIHEEEPVLMALGFGVALGLFVFQFASTRFCQALDTLNDSSPGSISSTALLDCLALLAMAGAVVVLVGGGVMTFLTGMIPVATTTIYLFVLVQFLAFVALCPAAVRIEISKDTSAGEEAIGVLTFFVKTFGRLAIVAYGVGAVLGTVTLLIASGMFLLSDSESAADSMAMCASQLLAGAILAPLLMYFLILLGFLGIDVIRAILSIAHRPFEIALCEEEPDEEEPSTGDQAEK